MSRHDGNDRRLERSSCRRWLRAALLAAALGASAAGCMSSGATARPDGAVKPALQTVPEWLGNAKPEW